MDRRSSLRWVQHPEFDELYELSADPHEERNVIHQPQNHGLVERLRSTSASWSSNPFLCSAQ